MYHVAPNCAFQPTDTYLQLWSCCQGVAVRIGYSCTEPKRLSRYIGAAAATCLISPHLTKRPVADYPCH